jgi:predicted membrane channel-forming protein YqfA (hemolysin III family)
MNPLGVVVLLAYSGFVFVLPPVLGRKAARSRKARIPFFIALGAFGVLAIYLLISSVQTSKKLHDPEFLKSYSNIHDLEDVAIGATYGLPILGVTMLIGVILGLCGWWSASADRIPEEEKRKDPPPPTSPSTDAR